MSYIELVLKYFRSKPSKILKIRSEKQIWAMFSGQHEKIKLGCGTSLVFSQTVPPKKNNLFDMELLSLRKL